MLLRVGELEQEILLFNINLFNKCLMYVMQKIMWL